ncbi:MAG: PKD domain-containing protein [Nanoarchaeota archaeon]|nr:PKD domain-containing protein [Nanoarchaeota archaeon]
MKKQKTKMKIKAFLILNMIMLFLISNIVFAEQIIDVNLVIHEDGSLDEKWVFLTEGESIEYPQTVSQSGTYSLKVLDGDSLITWYQNFDVYFGYSGPVTFGRDYLHLDSANENINFRIPYSLSMYELRLYHGDNIIFSRILNFCNNNGVCDSSENFESCPSDCPLDQNDVICIADEDGFCDPDCGEGIDPDCEDEFYPYAGDDKDVKAGRSVIFEGEVRDDGSGTYTYSWFFEDDGSTEIGQEITHTFAEDGVFAVTLTVTNEEGVFKDDTLLVTVSGLNCEITSSSCEGVSVFKIADFTNTHAQLEGSYPYTVCCTGVSGLGTDSSGEVVLGLARLDNSHVQKNSIGTYPYFAYLSAPGGITCDYVESSDNGYAACEDAGFDTCLASIQNDDNSHVGDCSAYNTKVCCKVGQESGGFFSWLGFSWMIDHFNKLL